MKINWLTAGLLSGGLLVTTALSSVTTQYIAGELSYHPALGQRFSFGLYQPFGWIDWQRRPWAESVKSVFLWPDATAGGLVAVLVIAGVAKSLQGGTRKPKPFPDVHGSAGWAVREDIEKTGLMGNTEGLYIGAWEDTATKTIHYLRDKSGAHIAGIAPTRSGKGLGWVMPNLLSCTDSAFICDPKGELWQLTAGWRKAIGQNVLRWQPGDPTLSCGFNFLEEIRLGTDYEVADAQNVAVMIVDPDGAGFSNHWDKAAFGFFTGLILHMLYVARDNGNPVPSLANLTQLLSSPTINPEVLCTAMSVSRYGIAISAAGTDQLKRDDKERGAVLSTAKTFVSLFLDPIVARNTNYSSFRIRDLMDHEKPTSLYVLVPGADSVRMRPLVRLLITMMLNKMVSMPIAFDPEQRPMRTHKHKLLLMMEEFPDLRRMLMFQAAMAIMAGQGITAFLIMQDREQLLAAYGQHQTIMANVHLIGVYAPNEIKTADWISHELGNRTINLEQYSASGKRGGWLSNLSHSFSPISRPLLTADEAKRLPGPVKEGSRVVQAGQMIILPTGHRPILGRQILYFEDPVFLARSMVLPPARSDDLEIVRQFRIINGISEVV